MRGAALFTALVAALLWGAPSVVVAAPPNRLSEPVAFPTDGTTLTRFHLSVRYVSSAGNPAAGITAQVGSLQVPLQLTSGTATDGTWSGSTLVPVGSWALTFHAAPEKGPRPSLPGPAITVVDDPAPTPNGRTGSREPAPTSSGGAAADDLVHLSVATPAARPKGAAEPAPDSRSPVAAPGGSDGEGGGAGVGTGSGSAEPAPEGSERGSREGRRRGGEAPAGRSSAGTPVAEDATIEGEASGTSREDLLLLLGGIVALATIALLGTGWMLASRGREDEPAGEAAATEAGVENGNRGPARGRGRRSAGLQAAHDPVLAALGLDDPDDGSQRPLRGAARGAAPRPRRGPRARL